MDLEVVRRLVGPRTRALLLVHPNNPTGSFVRQSELEFLFTCCRTQPLALVADEVFADYAFEETAGFSSGFAPTNAATGLRSSSGQPRPASCQRNLASPVSNLPDLTASAVKRPSIPNRVMTHAAQSEALTFTLSGLSKISALPQMKLAWVIVTGPTDLLREALARLEIIADTYLSLSTPLAYALPKLLETRHCLQPQVLERAQSNLRWLDTELLLSPPVTRLNTEGGWCVILKLPAIYSDEEWALELLRQDGVFVHPGHFYDFSADGHLVASLLPAPEVFKDGMRRVLTRVGLATRHPPPEIK
jgi:aspartate/methionine/tyrosine aminotransferase